MKPLIWDKPEINVPKKSDPRKTSLIVDTYRETMFPVYFNPELLGNKKPADLVRGSSDDQRVSERGSEVVGSGKSGTAASHRPSSN